MQSQRVSCAVLLSVALRLLHGAACDHEWEDIKEEKNNIAGFQAKKPWELFTDRSVRWQLLSILLLQSAQQLNGINAVCAESQSTIYCSCYSLPCSLYSSVLAFISSKWEKHEGSLVCSSFFFFFVFCRFTSTQITCSRKQVFPMTKYLTWPLALVPVNASPL